MTTKELSIPIKLLLEAISQVVSVELVTGDKYRGELIHADVNMSLQLGSATHTKKNGQVKKVEQVYLRGNQVKYFILPDILQESPMFKKVVTAKRKFDKRQQEKFQAQKKARTNNRLTKNL